MRYLNILSMRGTHISLASFVNPYCQFNGPSFTLTWASISKLINLPRLTIVPLANLSAFTIAPMLNGCSLCYCSHFSIKLHPTIWVAWPSASWYMARICCFLSTWLSQMFWSWQLIICYPTSKTSGQLSIIKIRLLHRQIKSVLMYPNVLLICLLAILSFWVHVTSNCIHSQENWSLTW